MFKNRRLTEFTRADQSLAEAHQSLRIKSNRVYIAGTRQSLLKEESRRQNESKGELELERYNTSYGNWKQKMKQFHNWLITCNILRSQLGIGFITVFYINTDRLTLDG